MTDASQSGEKIARLLPVGLRVFFQIAKRWRLTDHEAAAILGIPIGLLAAAKAGDLTGMGADTLFRIGNVLAIYKTLHTLLPIADRADGWVRKVNRAPMLSGRSVVDLLADGSIQSIVSVRCYLESELYICRRGSA